MKPLIGPPFDALRDCSRRTIEMYGWAGDATCGVFHVKRINDAPLRIIASSGEGWDHVSVSLPNRCPTWEEMKLIKQMFFRDDEWAFELHPPPDDNISIHKYCLHLWRPHDQEIPLPPSIFVGPTLTKEAS